MISRLRSQTGPARRGRGPPHPHRGRRSTISRLRAEPDDARAEAGSGAIGPEVGAPHAVYLLWPSDRLLHVKHLIDLDESALDAARRHLGTRTLKDTVNAALRLAAGQDPQGHDLDAALDALAAVEFVDRAQAWR